MARIKLATSFLVPDFSFSKLTVQSTNNTRTAVLTLKRLGGGSGQFDPLCCFSKNLFSRERVKPWFFVTFNVIISYISPKSFIEIPQLVQKI